MPQTLFRRDPVGTFISTVTGRSGLLNGKQTVGGSSIQMNNPAWITITGVCKMCNGGVANSMILPEEQATWGAVYNAGSIKPKPILQSVNIHYGGNHGLAQKLTANIKCFDRESFNAVRKSFLMPGNEISARFGYSADKQWNSSAADENSVSGFTVAVFSFSAGDDGTWIGTFTAVSSAEALKGIDVMQGLNMPGLQYMIAENQDPKEKVDVKSVAELIASDAQRNGRISIDEVDDADLPYVISKFTGYTKTPDSEVQASIVLYSSEHLCIDLISGWISSISTGVKKAFDQWDESKMSVNQVYVTLGYVVDRIINDGIKRSMEPAVKGKNSDKFKSLKIKFHEKWSKSKIPDLIDSGDPLSVLILGDNTARFVDTTGQEMDFNKIRGTAEGSYADVKALTGNDIRLDKILIHRDVVMSAFADAAGIQNNESESVDPKNTGDAVISLDKFFEKLFTVIKDVTGGALALRLTHDPDNQQRDSLYVVDQNYGGDADLKCVVFNPIDGDGSTISCNISSNGGSDEYRMAMFLGSSKKGDTAARLRNCEEELTDGRSEKRTDAINRHETIVQNPGMMVKSRFRGKEIDAFKSVMVDLTRYSPKVHEQYEFSNWPGMTIDVTIHGAWGILPGCAISTTQVPDVWMPESKGIYFAVTDVTHNFENSLWTTNIRGIMSFYDKLIQTVL